MRNKKFGILVFVALLSLSNCVQAEENPNYNYNQNEVIEKIKANKDTLSKAQEAMTAKDYQTAVTLLTGYINEKPKKYEAYKLRGDAYYALRRYYLAQKDYQTAVDIKSSEDKFMTNTKYVSAIVLGADKKEQLQNAELGDLYGALMYAQKAINDPAYTTSYENAVKYNSHIYLPQPNKNEINKINCPQKYGKILNPQGIDIKIYGAIDDIAKGNFNESLYKLQDVTGQYPNYYLGHYLTGVALSELEKDDDAIKSFEKAISLNPYDFESRASLGRIYFSKAETTFSESDARKSINYFKQALKQNRNCPTYYFYIGMNELQIGNTNVAISNFDKALQINPSDYNSMYYKLIAQYINGNYQDVVDGTSKLLLKHVSNVNSVLYLRALAYTKINDNDRALQDLNTIENNIEDIYNTDIKTTSVREKSLESYVHYLKAQIQHAKGAGSAEDNNIAYSNPIINRLAYAQKAMEPYEKSLQGDSISLGDYKKFESFYSTSLPKLLESGVVITYDDIDNQYDYIRTTFSDLGISFLYQNPNYKITTIKDYPYKKYSSKLNNEGLESLSIRPESDMANVELAKAQASNLRKSTPASELIVQNGQQSLAQMLASDVLSDKPKPVEIKEPVIRDASVKASAPKFNPEIPDAERIDTSKNIASGENYVSKNPALNTDNTKQVTKILNEEKIIQNQPVISQPDAIKNVESAKDGSVKISVKNPVSTSEVIIRNTSEDTATIPTVTKTLYEAEENIAQKSDSMRETVQTISDNAQDSVKEVKADTKEVIEKHANIEPDIIIQKQSNYLTINDINDIVELDTTNLNKKINNDSDLFDSNTVFTKPKAEVSALTPPVMLPEEPLVKAEQIAKNTSEIIQPKEVQAGVPVVNVPEIEPAESQADEVFVKEKLTEVIDMVAPKQSSDEVPNSATSTYSDVSMALNEADAIKAQRLKLKEEARYAKEQKKALARKQKEEEKLQKQKERLALLAQKEELKEQERAQKIKEKEEIAQIRHDLKQQKVLEQEQIKLEQQEAKLEKAKNETTEQATKSWLDSKLHKSDNQEPVAEKTAQQIRVEQSKQSKKLEKEMLKQQMILVQEQEKIVEQNDETKIQRLKTRLAAMRGSLSDEEKKAQKAQLKAERAKAKEEYKAKKLAKETIENNIDDAEKLVNEQIKAEQRAIQKAKRLELKEQKAYEMAQQKQIEAEQKAIRYAQKMEEKDKKAHEKVINNTNETKQNIFSKLKFWKKNQ